MDHTLTNSRVRSLFVSGSAIDWAAGIICGFFIVRYLSGVMYAEFPFTDAARLTFLPVQAMLWVGFGIFVGVPVRRFRRSLSHR